ncbi:MAG: ABC transporter substrate-binding protein [Alphaproteobacteria bacterium]|nr:ABC transporter substrate-binding protein [Alphaproteobacteria bacterium]
MFQQVHVALLGLVSLTVAAGYSVPEVFEVQAAEPIKIGVLMPISGGGAFYGSPAVVGVKIATDMLNAQGGILGRPVEFVVRDTQLKPAVAAAAAKELILKEEVDALIGAVSSGVALAISEVAKQEEVVYLVPIAKTTALTQKNGHDYVFVTSANTDIEGRQLAEMTRRVGAKRVCITGYDYAYSHSLFETFAEQVAGEVEIAGTFYVNLGTTDYNALIGQLIGTDCDTVVGAIWGGGYIAFVKQAGAFGLFDMKQFVWGAEVGSHEMANSLKLAYPSGQWANSYDAWYYEGSAMHRMFHAALKVEQGREATDMFPITTYIAMQFVAAAMEQAGSVDSAAMVKALERLEIETPMGMRRFNDRHEMNTGQLWGQMGFVATGDDIARILEAEYLTTEY